MIPAEAHHLIHEYQEDLSKIERSAINKSGRDLELFYQARTEKGGYPHCLRYNCSICKPCHKFMSAYQKTKRWDYNRVTLNTQLDSREAKLNDWKRGRQMVEVVAASIEQTLDLCELSEQQSSESGFSLDELTDELLKIESEE